MYDELICSLRCCADNPCYDCKYRGEYMDSCDGTLKTEAADAIEELSKQREYWELEASAQETDKNYLIDENRKLVEAWHNALDLRNRWIPVTEEPPLKVGDDGYNGYLVYANGYYEVADYTTDKFDNVPYFHVNGEYEPDVTHWMPLPPAPKEE